MEVASGYCKYYLEGFDIWVVEPFSQVGSKIGEGGCNGIILANGRLSFLGLTLRIGLVISKLRLDKWDMGHLRDWNRNSLLEECQVFIDTKRKWW